MFLKNSAGSDVRFKFAEAESEHTRQGDTRGSTLGLGCSLAVLVLGEVNRTPRRGLAREQSILSDHPAFIVLARR